MSDDIVEDTTLEEESTFTTEEQTALDGGWKPETEWEGGEGKSWVDAQTFNMRGELMDRIKSQTSQLRGQDKKMAKLEAGLKELSEHNKRIEEVSYKKALTDLKTLKKDALELDDYDQIVEIDDKIADLKETQNQPVVEDPVDDGVSPEITAWMSENSWYEKDVILRGAADAMAADLYQTRTDLRGDTEALLAEVKVQMQQRFPTEVGGRKVKRQSVTEPGNVNASTRSGAKKYTAKHLNAEQLTFGKTFVESGAMKDLAEYAGQLADIGELDIQKGL